MSITQTAAAVNTAAGPKPVCVYCGREGCKGECGRGYVPLRGTSAAKRLARSVGAAWDRYLGGAGADRTFAFRTMSAEQKAEYDAGLALFLAGAARNDDALGEYGVHGWLAGSREWNDGAAAYRTGFAQRNPSVVATWSPAKLAGYRAAKAEAEAAMSEGDFLAAALADLRGGIVQPYVVDLTDDPGDPVGYHESRQPYSF